MKLPLRASYVLFISFIWIHPNFCDQVSNVSASVHWSCICSFVQGNWSYAAVSNCSTSCQCSPAIENRWMCICAENGFPKIASGDQNRNCFEACNCTSGALNEGQHSIGHNSTRIVVAVLSGCAILTAIAFLASLACYIRRKDKWRIQSSAFSLDRETGCNSRTNLVYRHSSSFPETKLTTSSPVKSFAGYTMLTRQSLSDFRTSQSSAKRKFPGRRDADNGFTWPRNDLLSDPPRKTFRV